MLYINYMYGTQCMHVLFKLFSLFRSTCNTDKGARISSRNLTYVKKQTGMYRLHYTHNENKYRTHASHRLYLLRNITRYGSTE